MPTINNYSFSNVSYTVPEDSNVSGLYPTAVITITPNNGYTLDADMFQLDPESSYPEIESVVFTQSGQNVLCTVTFASTFVMPSNNVNIPLCIIGQGMVNLIYVEGTITANIGPNITGDGEEAGTIYANSGTLGLNETVFTRSYAALPGYYLSPGIFMTQGNQSNYTIVQTPGYDENDNLTSITYTANYIYPNYSVFDDAFVIKVSAVEIYVSPNTIRSYFFDNSPVLISGELRQLIVYGSFGADFLIYMLDSNDIEYPIANGTLDESGSYIANIQFPDLDGILTSESWRIFIEGDIDAGFTQPIPIEVLQQSLYPKISITASSTNPITGFDIVETVGLGLTSPTNVFINIDWTLTSATGTLDYLGNIGQDNFKFLTQVGINTLVDFDVVDSDEVRVVDADGLLIGDKFNGPNINVNLAPFAYEVVDITDNVLSVTPNITANKGDGLFIYRTNGNIINNINTVATVIDSSTINLNMSIQVTQFGNDDITFTLDLDEIIDYTPL